MILKNYIKISQKKGKKKLLLCISVFSAKITHSIYFPVMTNFTAASSAGESASLTDKKIESLEGKLLRGSYEKKYCLQETVPLLNQSISKENHVQLETHKELKILGKDPYVVSRLLTLKSSNFLRFQNFIAFI